MTLGAGRAAGAVAAEWQTGDSGSLLDNEMASREDAAFREGSLLRGWPPPLTISFRPAAAHTAQPAMRQPLRRVHLGSG